MSRARSTMRTGSPMSSTRISPPRPCSPACSRSCVASEKRHEVARDLRVRDGDRPAARDLLLEARDHAAGAAEHVAEAHQHELRAAALQALADDLGEALGRAHHAGRIDRLVGRDQHELLDLRRHRGAREHPGAVRVVAHRLPGVGLLHQRHVLVRGGVEHDARALAREDVLDQRRVLDVADDRRRPAAAGTRRRAPSGSRRAPPRRCRTARAAPGGTARSGGRAPRRSSRRRR